MKNLIAAIVFAFTCVNLAFAAGRTPAGQLKAKLLAVGDSPNYYWAWTYPWLNHGGWTGDMRNVVEKDGVFLPNPAETVTHMTVGRPCEKPYGVYRPFGGKLPDDTVFGKEARERIKHFDAPIAGAVAMAVDKMSMIKEDM